MDEATGIIALIGGGFVGLVVLIIVLAKVLSSPRVAGLVPAATTADEHIDTSTITGSAFSDLNSFVPDPSDDSSTDDGWSDDSGGSDSGSDSSDSGGGDD